jgi:plastocyanin
VTFASAAIANSSTQSSGSYATAMPTAAGTYTYECTIHASIGMTGSVLVQ